MLVKVAGSSFRRWLLDIKQLVSAVAHQATQINKEYSTMSSNQVSEADRRVVRRSPQLDEVILFFLIRLQ